MKSSTNPTQPTRRDLMRAAAAAPLVWAGAGSPFERSSAEARALVVVELVGGNDGLNTVVPIADPAYHRARSAVRIASRDALRLGRPGGNERETEFGLHPACRGLHRLYHDGQLAIRHGVGYPRPDRSHFRSRDIWHTADPAFEAVHSETTGWLGRLASELVGPRCPVPAVSVGSLRVPLAMRSKDVVVPALERIEDYELLVRGGTPRAGLLDVLDRTAADSQADPRLKKLAAIARDAARGAEDLRAAVARYRPKAEYGGALGRRLQLLAQVLCSGFGSRVFHVELAGFDTHAGQLGIQAGLLKDLSDGLAAFARDLRGHGLWDRVTVLVHSEFGRRVRENASQGTDHGAAGPVFVLGGKVNAGSHGRAPSLTQLDDGDLIATGDFRSIYRGITDWLGADARRVLPGAPAAESLLG